MIKHRLKNGKIQSIDVDSLIYPHLSAWLAVNANKDDDITEYEKRSGRGQT